MIKINLYYCSTKLQVAHTAKVWVSEIKSAYTSAFFVIA